MPNQCSTHYDTLPSTLERMFILSQFLRGGSENIWTLGVVFSSVERKTVDAGSDYIFLVYIYLQYDIVPGIV